MKRYLVIMFMGTLCKMIAQQNPTIDNYLFNPIAISPAQAGLQNGALQTIYDAQWVGIKGAPRTGTLSYDYMHPKRFGFNLNIMEDAIGPVNLQTVGLTTAYHLQLAENIYLSTGIRYTLSAVAINFDDEYYHDKIDVNIYNINAPWYQNVDLSMNLRGDQFYGGFTIKNMVRQEMYDNNFTARGGHVYGGYHFNITDDFRVTPSFLVTLTENAPMDINAHAYLEYKEKIGMGLNISPGDEYGVFFKATVSPGIMMFYQYNIPLSELAYITKQSHVIGLGFDFNNKKRVISPKYFL